LITDAWLANSGDGIIAIAVERMVRAVAPGSAVLHAAYHADPVADAYPGLSFVPPLATLVGVEGAPSPPDGWGEQVGRQLVRDADLVISQGGGFLLEHYQPWQRLFALAEVVDLGTPLVVLGQSIGLFRAARARALLRRTMRESRYVTVRDEDSRATVLDLGVDPGRVALTSDLSLTLFDQAPVIADSRQGIAVVLTVHEQTAGQTEDRVELATVVLSDVVRRARGELVTVASTVQGLGRYGMEDDAATAAAAVSRLPGELQSGVRLVEGYLGPADAIALYGQQRAVVSQRLHPALVAFSQGVPAALLLSASKVGVLADADLGRMVCEEPTNSVARRRSLDAALNRGARSGADLWAALDPLRRRAELNAQILADVLAELR
jgi:hypothetical protein